MLKLIFSTAALLAGFLWAQDPPRGVPGDLPGFNQGAGSAASKPPSASPAKSGAEGSAGEFVIKGESKMNVDSDKPALNIGIEENKSVEPMLETEKELVLKSPPMISDIKEAAPVRQESDFLIIPSFKEFRQDSVAHEFHPAAELKRIFEEPNPSRAKDFARWDFKVADAHGRIFYTAGGKGLPPENITVHTTNSKGETVRVGSPYSGVLTYSDSAGQLHTVICESFSLSGLIHKAAQGFTVHLSLSNVFTKKESSEISADGKKLLKETADWIKTRRASRSPINIEIYARNMAQAQAQAEALAGQIGADLRRLRGEISASGKAAASGLDERVEISIYSNYRD